jgi:hypothetical protein
MRISGKTYVYNGEDNHIQWVEGVILVNHKQFKVNIGKFNNKVLIKPYNGVTSKCENDDCINNPNKRGYHTDEYEYLFRFVKGHCEDFDENRIIDVTDAVSNIYG